MALFFFSPFVCASSSPHNKKMEMLQQQLNGDYNYEKNA